MWLKTDVNPVLALNSEKIPKHFDGKEAVKHVAEAQAKGILSTAEIHGAEMPGHLFAGADAARETAVVLLLVWILLSHVDASLLTALQMIALFAMGWMIWKGGRAAWLAWSRLERMHRIVEQERWEIQHHRGQEQEELKELYRAKGFEGKLLDDVVDVLMADDERLLKVMVEEELCLTLGTFDHPLKQAIGAFIGTLAATIICLLLFFGFGDKGLWLGSFISLAVSAGISAQAEGNRKVPAIVWNLAITALTVSFVYFLIAYIH